MFNVRLAGGHLYGKQLFTWLSLVVSLMASFVLSFFPLDVLDEIWDLTESVSEGFLSYSYRAQRKEKVKEADRKRGEKTISKSGQEWTLPAQLGQLKTGQDGKGLLRIHLLCPDHLPRSWDRIEWNRSILSIC